MPADTLVFPSEEALIAALTSELVPASVQARPVQSWTGDSGAIYVRPDMPLDADVVQALRAAGAAWLESEPQPGQRLRPARVWPQLIAPRKSAGDHTHRGQTVLFYVDAAQGPRPATSQPPGTLLGLAAELLRLGCDRCSYQLLGQAGQQIALVRAFDPPYYTVAACGERDAAYRAFLPLRSGQTRTWIELGYEHPLARTLEPPEGCMGLITGDGDWLELPDGPWHDIFEFIELTVPGGSRGHEPMPLPHKLTVPLHLTPITRSEPPSLWVLRQRRDRSAPGSAPERVIDQLESLMGSLPESIIARLLFAVLGPADDPLVVLRARLGRAGPPQLDVAGMAMVPLSSIGNLYIPHDAMIEPPLRRDTLRALLAPEDERVYWLQPTDERAFVVESTPERAFTPLAEWIEYLVHRSAEELAPWVRSVTFELESFQSIGSEWAHSAEPPQVEQNDPRPRTPRAPQRAEPREPVRQPIPAVTDSADATTDEARATAAVAPRRASPLELELAERERAFLDSSAPADAPARSEMWLDMARLLHELERHRDAALCFVRALWELPRNDCQEVVREWAHAEAAAMDADPDELLWAPVAEQPAPDAAGADRVRAAAVQWIATVLADVEPGALPADPAGNPLGRNRAMHTVQQWFERSEEVLDVRTRWLLRWTLAEQLGGDPLGLARTRDRVLQSLRSGLSLTRDVPTFLRFLGHPGGSDSVAVSQLVASLESLVDLFDRTRRQRSPIEAPTASTRAYVSLVIAYGFARLGRADRSSSLRRHAMEHLDLNDPVHGFLVRAYAARIDQALEGLPPEAPLPGDVAGALAELQDGKDQNQLARYKVDRLRQASAILEPHERIDAMRGFLQRRRDPGGQELSALRAMSATERSAEVARLLDVALSAETPIEERTRLLDGLMDAFPMLPDAQAVPALRRILGAVGDIAPSPRALLLEEALMLAGYFGREELAARIARSIAALVTELPSADAEALAPAFGACLRSLRRVGLRDHAATLVDALSAKLTGEGVQALEARLHLAAGLAHLGHFERARPTLARAHEVLDSAEFRVVDHRLRLVHALAQAYAECPQEQALEGLAALAGQLAMITDNYNTNTHFCLSVISFMEALVLGYAKSDLALGELGRRWLDEDEYLVRRRIHRELGERS